MFKKGQSGNPAGRKPGESPFAKYRAMLASRSDELIDKVIELALSGDTTALKLCMDRLFPPLKPTEEPQGPVLLPVDAQEEHIGRLVLAGEVSPQVAVTWLKLRLASQIGQGKTSMSHAEFVKWLNEEVQFDPPIATERYEEAL